MTQRVLVLGNSHLAALREGWRANPGRWPAIAPTFVGAHKDLLLQTEVRDGRFLPVRTAARAAFSRLGGGDGADIAAQDLIVICGCSVALAIAALIWRDMRWGALASLDTVPDLAGMTPRLVSFAAARASLEHNLSQRLAPALARHLRAQGVAQPVWLAAQPHVSAVIATRPRPDTRALNDALAQGDAAELAHLFHAAAARALAVAAASFLPQPEQTVQDHILTAVPFVRDATRLAAKPGLKQDEDDIRHANAAYGALVLDQIVARLATERQPGAAHQSGRSAPKGTIPRPARC